MEIKKERTIIKVYDGEHLRGGWDIVKNVFIGIHGQELKGISKPFMSAIGGELHESPLACCVREILNGRDNARDYDWAVVAPRLEMLISLNLSIGYYDYNTWHHLGLPDYNMPTLDKRFVDFIRNQYDNTFSVKAVSEYTILQENQDIFANMNPAEISWAIDILKAAKDDTRLNKYTDWVKGMIVRGLHEKVNFSYGVSSFYDMLSTWFRMIRAMDDTLDVKHNLLTNYNILKWMYNKYSEENYDKILAKYNDCDWLRFEDDNYIVIPLTTRDMFHNEAEYQHNCVERLYMESVATGDTHVVSIRRKDNPNMPYITCEVNNNHKIVQYLLRFNNRPTNEKDLEFKAIYQNYLNLSLSQD